MKIAVAEKISGGVLQVKFYLGRKLMLTIATNSPSRVINYYLTHDDIEDGWTRYEIVE